MIWHLPTYADLEEVPSKCEIRCPSCRCRRTADELFPVKTLPLDVQAAIWNVRPNEPDYLCGACVERVVGAGAVTAEAWLYHQGAPAPVIQAAKERAERRKKRQGGQT